MNRSSAENECPFVVVEPEDVRSARCAAFLEHCRALGNGRALARWSDFKLHKLPSDMIPYMAVVDVDVDVDVEADGAAKVFTYRFWGTGHTSLKGVDMTGRKVSEIRAPALASIGQQQYETVLAERRPLIFVHALKPYGPWKDEIQVAVRVPLSEDGKTVSQVVSYSNFTEDRQAWADVYWRAVNGAGGRNKRSAGC